MIHHRKQTDTARKQKIELERNTMWNSGAIEIHQLNFVGHDWKRSETKKRTGFKSETALNLRRETSSVSLNPKRLLEFR